MASTTQVINVSHNAYENVSEGNLNCILLIKYLEPVRVYIGGEQPEEDTDLWFTPGQRNQDDSYTGFRVVAQFINLEAETDVWVRSELNPVDVMVIRGGVSIT